VGGWVFVCVCVCVCVCVLACACACAFVCERESVCVYISIGGPPLRPQPLPRAKEGSIIRVPQHGRSLSTLCRSILTQL
jgi:hypothetical protein